MTDPRYEVIIYFSSEDKAFIAEVPELRGCAADGMTYEEALVQGLSRSGSRPRTSSAGPFPNPEGD